MYSAKRGSALYHLSASLIVAVGINFLLLYLVYQLVTPTHVSEPKLFNLNWVDLIRLKPQDLQEPEPEPLKKPEQKLGFPTPAKPPPRKLEPPRPSPPVKSPPVQKPVTPKRINPPKPADLQPKPSAPVSPRVTVPALAAMPSRITGDPALKGHKTGPVDTLGTSGLGIDENVTPIYRSAPRYPLRAQRAGIEGVVTVEFTITSEGAVSDPLIIKAEPSEIFDEAVLEAITKWKFKPRIVNGKPVARRARQRISFLLNKE